MMFFILQRRKVKEVSPGHRSSKRLDQDSDTGWWTSETTFIMISLVLLFICAYIRDCAWYFIYVISLILCQRSGVGDIIVLIL